MSQKQKRLAHHVKEACERMGAAPVVHRTFDDEVAPRYSAACTWTAVCCKLPLCCKLALFPCLTEYMRQKAQLQA